MAAGLGRQGGNITKPLPNDDELASEDLLGKPYWRKMERGRAHSRPMSSKTTVEGDATEGGAVEMADQSFDSQYFIFFSVFLLCVNCKIK